MPETALAGRGIAITRPLEQARGLAELIRQQHGRPILFPLLDIQPLDDYSAFDRVLDQLPHADWAIFISTNAVEQGVPRLQRRYPDLPRRLRFAGIGPSTAARLADFGIRQVLVPRERYDSEHLLALPEMQQVQGLRILLFRGTGGREMLADGLRARGAEVIPAECYRRSNPQQDAGELAALWQNNQLHACVVTSSEALRNLLALAASEQWLKAVPLCVNHPRIAEQATQQGLHVVLAEGPGDPAMLRCLTSLLRKS